MPRQVHTLHSLKKNSGMKKSQPIKMQQQTEGIKGNPFKCMFVHPELVGLIYLT